MKKGRLFLICAAALGLAPGTFLRTTYDLDSSQTVITARALPDRDGVSGELTVNGVWELTASHPFFGGFSALVADSNGALIIGSDKGWRLDLPLESSEPQAAGARFTYFAERQDSYAEMTDIESMARDPETGTVWTGYELFNTIQRDTAGGETTRRRPAEMRDWRNASGPETMVRLADGSFIIIAESHEIGADDDNQPALLFARDPIEDTAPTPFRFEAPPDYLPTDAVQIPGGDVLILLRRVAYTIPAQFDAAIMRADPAEITRDEVWSGDIIAYLDGPVFGENFEGIVYVPSGAQESGDIYLISDDNLSVFQRSLLVRLALPNTP